MNQDGSVPYTELTIIMPTRLRNKQVPLAQLFYVPLRLALELLALEEDFALFDRSPDGLDEEDGFDEADGVELGLLEGTDEGRELGLELLEGADDSDGAKDGEDVVEGETDADGDDDADGTSVASNVCAPS